MVDKNGSPMPSESALLGTKTVLGWLATVPCLALPPSLSVVLFAVNLAAARVVWEDGTYMEKMPPSEWLGGKSVGHFLD